MDVLTAHVNSLIRARVKEMSKGSQLRAMRQQLAQPVGLSWHEEQIVAKEALIVELRHEIEDLKAENARLRKKVERARTC